MNDKYTLKPFIEKNSVERMLYQLLPGGIGRYVDVDRAAHFEGLKIGLNLYFTATSLSILLFLYLLNKHVCVV